MKKSNSFGLSQNAPGEQQANDLKIYLSLDKTGSDYQQLMSTISAKLERSRYSWEVDEELHTLWDLGDHGDVPAFLRYAVALLMDGKDWYNPEEAKVVLEAIIEGEGPALRLPGGMVNESEL